MNFRRSIVSFLTIFKLLSIGINPASAVSISSYIPATQKQVKEEVNSNWVQARSNKDFAFTEIVDQVSGIKILKLKDLKTGYIRTLIQSSAIERLGKQRDVAPNGRTVVFETVTKVGDEYINQTFLFNTNGQKFFLLSDGIRRKLDQTVDLEKIEFKDKKVELSYIRKDQKDLETKTVELIAKYSLVHKINNNEDRISKFYGGSIPYGVKDLKSFEEQGKTRYTVSFDPKISSIKKHEFIIENNKITKFFEFNKNDQISDSKTEFLHNGNITENFIYNSEDELTYSGSSFGEPSIDLISLNHYLRKEISEFYQGKLNEKAKISILGKKFFIDLNDDSEYPVQSLLFAFSYSNFGDYGFYSFSRQNRNMNKKEFFIFSNKNQSVSYSKSIDELSEKVVINEVDQFNYDYIELSSSMHSNYIGIHK